MKLMSQSPDVCEMGEVLSCVLKFFCLFLGFKDFSNFMFSSFGIAPLKSFHIFVLKEDFYSNISFFLLNSGNKC